MGGPWGTACDAAVLPAAVESGFGAVAGVPGEVGGVPGVVGGVPGVVGGVPAAVAGVPGALLVDAAASESWCAVFCTRRIESRMARRARTMESCLTESRCERCFTVVSCRIVDGVVSCGLTIDVSGGRIESVCARSPQDIRSKKR